MSRRFTNKERFLKIIEKDIYYKGDKNLTKHLYRKYLKTLKEYGKCNATMLFECNTVRNKTFFINRGFSEAESEREVYKRQNRGYSSNRTAHQIHVSNKKRKSTMSKKSSVEIAKINKLKGKGYDPNFISKKYNISLEEAQQRISKRKHKKVDSYKKHLKSIGGYKREWSSRCIEFWRSRGYSIEEAKESLKYKFDTRSLESICNRLGVGVDEATKIQQSINQKCRDTFNNKTEQEKKEILLKRTKHFKTYSKVSYNFFEKLRSRLEDIDVTWLYGENEYFLWDESVNSDRRIYFYDLTIPEINLMVEYNGIIFHPRVSDTWATTVAESVKKDNRKKRVAERNGYKLHYVWDNENEEVALTRLVSIIEKKYDN